MLGRAYTPEEDFGGNSAVLLLSHEFWQRQLAGRTDVVGMSVPTDRGPRTILGIMPPGFTIVGQKADFLAPYGATLDQLRAARGRGSSYAIARLRDGVTFEQASGDMRSLFARLEKEEPERNARRTVMVLRVQDQLLGELRPALFALIGAVLMVLLVACVNVANLLLARSASREREIGVRTALGAQRGRLVRQVLAESLLARGRGALPAGPARAGRRSHSGTAARADDAGSDGRRLHHGRRARDGARVRYRAGIRFDKSRERGAP
jgi:putative ABC transport system permease protein